MQNLAGKNTGDLLTAAEWNQLPTEVQNVITTTGQVLTSGDLLQLTRGIQVYVASGTFFTDSGVANNYTLAITGTLLAPNAYTNGQVIRFFANATNTGASTVNVSGIGVRNLVRSNLSALTGGEIQAGDLIFAVYNGSSFVVVASGLENAFDQTNGVGIKDPSGSNPEVQLLSSSLALIAAVRGSSGGAMNLHSNVNGNLAVISARDTGGVDRDGFVADPDGSANMNFAGAPTAQTLAAGAGGLQANNTLTGAGFERVLTTSDLLAALANAFDITDGIAVQDPSGNTPIVELRNSGGTPFGRFQYDGSGNVVMRGVGNSINARVQATNSSGLVQDAFVGLADSSSLVNHDGLNVLRTILQGLRVADQSGSNVPLLEFMNSAFGVTYAQIEGHSGNGLSIRNMVSASTMEIQSRDGGGTDRDMITANGNTFVGQHYNGAQVARTLLASAGGLEVNNLDTGAGFERVLTESDLGSGGIGDFLNAANGYFELGPFLIQWGTVDVPDQGGSGNLAVNFPTAFAAFYALAFSEGNTIPGQFNDKIVIVDGTPTTTQWFVHHQDNSAGESARVRWVAIGTHP